MEEVHRLIQGYEVAYRCPHRREVYYYYSSNDNEALRFEVSFDENQRVLGLSGEDSNSRVISINDCSPGWLGE